MTIRRQSLLLALAILPSLLLAGCPSSSSDNNNNNPPPASPTLLSIAITPSPVNVTVGGATQQLTVTGTYSDTSTANLTAGSTFVSSAPAVATVGAATGVVTAVTGGTATVTATHTASGKTATVTVNVLKVLNSIAITPSPVNLVVAGTQQLTVTGTYNDASTANLTTGSTFVSSATGVATVSSPGGLVTAVAAGTATVTATHTASGKTATVTVNVTAGGPTLVSIAITPSPVNLAVAGTQQLTVTGTYSSGPTQDLTAGSTFVSSATGVATVGASTGLVTAIALGTATVTATHTASGKTATVTVHVYDPLSAHVFWDDYDPGALPLAGFTGSFTAAHPLTRDATTTNNSRASLKMTTDATCASFIGGYIKAVAPRDQRAYNAISFWVKSDVAVTIANIGFGDDQTQAKNAFNVESHGPSGTGYAITTTWTKHYIPVPTPAALGALSGLFYFSGGCPAAPTNVWFNDIQFEAVNATATFGAVSNASTNAPATLSAQVGTPALIGDPGPNTIFYASATVYIVGWAYFSYTSTDATVATTNADGNVVGLKAGTATITMSFPGTALARAIVVTVTLPLATPTNNAVDPIVAPGNVISLFSTAYATTPGNRSVDTWRTSWSAGNNELVDPYPISGGHAVKQYTLHHFVGIEFGLTTPANAVDATTMTHFHMDVWSPNPPAKLQIQLVNDVNNTIPAKIIASFDATTIATAGWVGLEIPLASFAPALTNKSLLNQMLFLALDGAGAPTNSVVYVDNIYFHK